MAICTAILATNYGLQFFSFTSNTATASYVPVIIFIIFPFFLGIGNGIPARNGKADTKAAEASSSERPDRLSSSNYLDKVETEHEDRYMTWATE